LDFRCIAFAISKVFFSTESFGWLEFYSLILVFTLQRAAVLRKRFDIHIAGQNAPAPLESFEELISRLVFSTTTHFWL
jgi:hypothetical protein